MYLVVIAWLYVTLMMALAEALSPVGSVLGAIVTFVLYGLLPLGILVYILGTPGRKRKLRAREAAECAAQTDNAAPDAPNALEAPEAPDEPAMNGSASGNVRVAPDAGSKTAAAAQAGGVAPVRKKH